MGGQTDRVDLAMIQQTVTALLAVYKQKNKDNEKMSLFQDENELFEMQVSVWEIIGAKTKTVSIPLPHNMYPKDRDALLFVKDLKHLKLTEMSEHHYKDLLQEKGVERVTQVMPLRVLKKEYKSFEAKRNLSKSYDVFLADVNIFGWLSDLLGKEFYKRNKYPIAIDLEKKDLKGVVSRAMNAAYIRLSNRGSCSSANIAHTGMEPDHIVSNVQQAITTIGEKINGGWSNIKSIHLATKSSISLPVYTNLIRPEWDLPNLPAELSNEDLDNLQLQLKLEKAKTIKTLRKKKDLHPDEPLKMKKQKTSISFKAKSMAGLTRKQKKAAVKNMMPRQKLRQKKMDSKVKGNKWQS